MKESTIEILIMLHLFAIKKSVRKYRKYKTDPMDGRSREHLTDEKN
jgi:hypothetical protein